VQRWSPRRSSRPTRTSSTTTASLAAKVLVGWRVRLAAVRTEKRMADDLTPTEEDLQLLDLAARPVPAQVD